MPRKTYTGQVVTGSKLGPTLMQYTILMRMVTCRCGKVFWKPDATVSAVGWLHCGCMTKGGPAAKPSGSVPDAPTEAHGFLPAAA